MVLLSAFSLQSFVLDFFSNDVCMIEKNTVLFICIHERVILIVFAVSIKFFYESGLAILNLIACIKQVRPNDVWIGVTCSYFIYKKLT